MAFEVTYTDCSAETYQEIRKIIALWNERSQEYKVKTSGSTGTPKSILLRREQLEASAKRSNAFFGLNESSRVLMPLSPHTIGGKMMGSNSTSARNNSGLRNAAISRSFSAGVPMVAAGEVTAT